MKRVLLDYLRRKGWMIALGGVVVLALSLAQALWPQQMPQAHIRSTLFQFTFLMAALPLSLDLQRGVMRVTSVLPLTADQLGRAWWWAGVGVPASFVSLALLLCAAVKVLVNPGIAVQWGTLTITILSVWLWLGSAFTLLFNLGTSPAQDWRQRTRNIGGGLAWGLMAGGSFVFVRWIEAYVEARIVLLTIGVALTVIGWLRAETLVSTRASLRTGAPAGCSRADARVLDAEKKSGGLSFLITRTCLRAVTVGLLMLALSPVMMVVMNTKDWRGALKNSAYSSPMPFWLVLVFGLLPVLSQLRFLRTLPLSAGKLALSLLSMFLIPCLVIGAASMLFAHLVCGPEAALLIGTRDLFVASALSLVVPFALWRGFGRITYALLVFGVVALQTGQLIYGSSLGRHLLLAAPLAIILPVVAFLLTRLTLKRGGQAYRATTALFPQAWSGAR